MNRSLRLSIKLSFRRLEFSTFNRVFLSILCAFTLFYGMAEVFHGFWSIQGFFRDEERSLGFGVLRIGGYIVMVHAFIRGFQVSPYAALIEMKSLFYRACDFSFGQWT